MSPPVDRTLGHRLADWPGLPPMPVTAARLLGELSDPAVTPGRLASLLEGDPALAARALRHANSAYYGFPRRVTRLVESIMVIGFSALRSLVLASVAQGLATKPVSGYDLGQGELWRHLVATARCARLLARSSRIADPEEAYTAGVLHDLGKMALADLLADRWVEALALAQGAQRPFVEIERELFGADHAEIGGEIARRWGLPDALVEAIACHHEPQRARAQPLVAVVHVADAVALSLGIGVGTDGLMYPLDPAACRLVGLGEELGEAERSAGWSRLVSELVVELAEEEGRGPPAA